MLIDNQDYIEQIEVVNIFSSMGLKGGIINYMCMGLKGNDEFPLFPLKCLNMLAFGRPFQKGGGRRPPKKDLPRKTKSSQIFSLCTSILTLLQKYNAD
jgi:hypothetical protein